MNMEKKLPLLALVGDVNSHGGGALQTPPQSKWSIGGILVTTVDTVAAGDNLFHLPGSTNSSSGSDKWTVQSKAIHRHGDSRYCGASTVVSSQSSFSIGA